MFQFYKKLQFLKSQIIVWNKHVFKNVFSQKGQVVKNLEDVHSHIILNGLTLDLYVKQKVLQAEWEELCGREEEYWRQKSRESWLQEGDKNTKFFHMLVKQRRASNTIFQIGSSDSNDILSDATSIQNEGVKFFKNLLAPAPNDQPSHVLTEEMLSAIPSLITPQDNAFLIGPFTLTEIKEVVFSMSSDKAPGPDGFIGGFFRNVGTLFPLIFSLQWRNRESTASCLRISIVPI
jgi:hypothetical protein